MTSGSATSIKQEPSPVVMAAHVGSGGRCFGGSSGYGSNSDNWRKKEESDHHHCSDSPSCIDSKGFAGVILLMTTTVIVADSRTILQLVAFMTCVSK